jgi:hypothetical protein
MQVVPTNPRQTSKPRWIDRALPVLFVIALTFVSFVGGAFVAEFDVPWYQETLKPSFQGLKALEEERVLSQGLHGWTLARDAKVGVTINDTQATQTGLTLISSFDQGCGAQLIAMDGRIVHRWQLPFREVWPDAEHVSTPVSDNRIHWWRTHVFPNGDLLANYAGIADSPNGYGLVKIDKDSRVIWKHPDAIHHDFAIDDGGSIFALVHSIRKSKLKSAPHLRTPILEDYVVVLSPDGQETQRVSLFNAFWRSQFRGYLDSMQSNSKGDHTHCNAIDLIPREFAKKHRFCSPGDLMISLRNPDVIAILNLERGKIVWAAKGTWHRQHDSDPLANGNVMLFDNLGNQREGGKSRIIEWNPRTGAIVWSFAGTREAPFESLVRSCQQLLPNGNLLVTESDHGRLLEVTRDHRIVWEYCNPGRSGEKKELVAVIFNAERYDPRELTFLHSGKRNESLADKSKSTKKNTSSVK